MILLSLHQSHRAFPFSSVVWLFLYKVKSTIIYYGLVNYCMMIFARSSLWSFQLSWTCRLDTLSMLPSIHRSILNGSMVRKSSLQLPVGTPYMWAVLLCFAWTGRNGYHLQCISCCLGWILHWELNWHKRIFWVGTSLTNYVNQWWNQVVEWVNLFLVKKHQTFWYQQQI